LDAKTRLAIDRNLIPDRHNENSWTKKELEELALESTRTIEIDEFVEKSEIDPRYLIRPYYLRLAALPPA
jgi:hypothetical protein